MSKEKINTSKSIVSVKPAGDGKPVIFITRKVGMAACLLKLPTGWPYAGRVTTGFTPTEEKQEKKAG